MRFFACVILLLVALLEESWAFANMLCRQHCEDKSFEVGEMIMGEPVISSTEKRIVLLDAKGEDVASSSSFPLSKEARYTVQLLSKVSQFALEVECSGCYFVEGKCNNKRRTIQVNATLVVPVGHRGQVEVRALWAKLYGKVSASQPFILSQPEEEL